MSCLYKLGLLFIRLKIQIFAFERVIKGTKVIAEFKRMQSRDKDQTWNTDTHSKEHKVTKIIHTK